MLRLVLIALLSTASASYASEDYFQLKVREALGLLPFNQNVEIEVASLKSDKLMGNNLCELSEEVEFGLTIRKRNKQKILISSRLVELAQSEKRQFPCLHGSYEKVLLATLVHEMTHVRDNIEGISVDPDFQRIVGVKKVRLSGRVRILNQNATASPDTYELTNLAESLATNVEYLLLDPEFECRKPATANFLAKRLGITLLGFCKKNYEVMGQSGYIEDNYLYRASIDPARIYQIHYLFAGRGDALMSRWGHAMFRLIVCAPHRKVAGPECLRDVSNHLVLSYRAHVTDMQINYAKGIKGDYPSQLYIMRFHEVQQEYNKFELRDLFSVPLKLTSSEKVDFLNLTLERYWAYQGKYYFFGNNCGTEAQKHLAMALPEDDARLIRSVTPLRMYNDIVKSGIGENKGERLKGSQIELEKVFFELKKIGFYSNKKLKKFFKKTTAEKRLAQYQAVFSKENFDDVTFKRVVLKIIFMERYLQSKFLKNLPTKAYKLMNKRKSIKREIVALSEGMKTLTMQPWEIVSGKYGVPSAEEFNTDYSSYVKTRKSELSEGQEKQLASLQNILQEDLFKKELNEIENMTEIKKLTNQLLLKSSKFLEGP